MVGAARATLTFPNRIKIDGVRVSQLKEIWTLNSDNKQLPGKRKTCAIRSNGSNEKVANSPEKVSEIKNRQPTATL